MIEDDIDHFCFCDYCDGECFDLFEVDEGWISEKEGNKTSMVCEICYVELKKVQREYEQFDLNE